MDLLRDFQGRYPLVAVHLRQTIAGSATSLAEVRSGALDMALVSTPAESLPGLRLDEIHREPMVFACARDHPLGQRVAVSILDLVGLPFIDYPTGWGNRTVVDLAFAAARAIRTEVTDFRLACSLVGRDLGVTIVPVSAVDESIAHIPMREPLEWSVKLARPAGRRPLASPTRSSTPTRRSGPRATSSKTGKTESRIGPRTSIWRVEGESGTSPAATSPAQIRVVVDRHLDVVEASAMASALSAAFRVGNNLARSIFLNPESQQSFEDWAAAAALATSMLRRSLSRHGRDPRYDDLVGELGAHSTRFGKYWAQPEVDGWEHGVLRYFNPITGVQTYEYTLERQPDGRVKMLWSPADDASRSASHDLWELSRHL